MVTRAVVLAAGLGRRLGELGSRMPKALVPLAGRPALVHLFDALAASGIEHATVVVGHLGEHVEAAVGRRLAGIEVGYVWQTEPRGTADALMCARPRIAEDDAFLLSFGDIVVTPATCIRLAIAGAASLAAGDAGAILVTEGGDVSRGAAVVARADGVVTGLEEKAPPGRWPGARNSAGMYVLGPDVWPAAAAVEPSPRGELELTTALAARIAAGARYVAVPTDGYWFDLADAACVAAADAALRCGALSGT